MLDIVMAVMVLAYGDGLDTRVGPEAEAEIILQVAEEYELNEEQTMLLVCLRRCENGPDGSEFGVLHDQPGHRSHRYKGQPRKSLRLQAQWAAGTVRDRYTGSLGLFCKKWCPGNPDQLVKNIGTYLVLMKGTK